MMIICTVEVMRTRLDEGWKEGKRVGQKKAAHEALRSMQACRTGLAAKTNQVYLIHGWAEREVRNSAVCQTLSARSAGSLSTFIANSVTILSHDLAL